MPERRLMKINVDALTSTYQEISNITHMQITMRSREAVHRVALVMKTTMKDIMTRMMT